MDNKVVKILIFAIGIPLIFYAVHTFALMRSGTSGSGSLDAATWSVTRNYSQRFLELTFGR